MNQASDSRPARASRARWIAAGFVLAFAASILTVVYTGLNVEGSRAEFDSGFRPVTMTVGDTRSIDLVFESPSAFPDAMLEITLPAAVRFPGQPDRREDRRPVSVSPGKNEFTVDIEATAPGRGYLEARVEADEPVGLFRVFVTVTAE